ncbi:hypothetical protein [Georgenia faecalis]|uniref:DUF222 domain-containing protein n=1 Tax=Georgenia faecalis TaxID=2483799 RepID=A0ABV9D7D7_9MICO|nr:hypothetical protein [Georgenia faecalis]
MDTPAEDDLTAELARTISALQREVHWLRRERAAAAGDGGPAPEDPADARLLEPIAEDLRQRVAHALGGGSHAWGGLSQARRERLLETADAVVAEVGPVFADALEAIPGATAVRLAQRRYGLAPHSDVEELLAHARAEGSARAAGDLTRELDAVRTEASTLRAAVQAVELVVGEGERMAAEHASPVAVEVATWFTDRLRRALATPDVTLGDALEAERERVLLAVAERLGHTGLAALTWYGEMCALLDARGGDPDAPTG